MPHLLLDDVPVEIVRKQIRTLRLTISAPEGRVRVSAPLQLPIETIYEFLQARRSWISRHRTRIQARPKPALVTFSTGETHYYQGSGYTLRVLPTLGRPKVDLQAEAGYLDLYVKAESTAEERAAVLQAWYRAGLKKQLPELLARWEPVVGVQAREWGVKQMKTRWGTCSIAARRIWLNVELMKYPPLCLEYVLVHELVHLHERLHNARFWSLMDRFMPDWRQHKEALRTLTNVPDAD